MIIDEESQVDIKVDIMAEFFLVQLHIYQVDLISNINLGTISGLTK